MKIQFADSFTKSLKTMVNHQTWWYKTYEFIRWDIWHFFKNIWRFRKELYSHRWWDSGFTLEMLERSLIIMEKGMHGGLEVRESRDKKIQKMQRAIELLKNRREDNYIERAEGELGNLIMKDWEVEDIGDGLSQLVDKDTPEEKEHNRKVFQRTREIEEEEWKELWEIFKGQDIRGYKKLSKSLTTEEHKNRDIWNEWFDGSDMRGWWD